ncbi:hypothetical protein AURDEDRAFT_171260 [Auricularia subglabra TFB-10046 SS5]|nr:hypothetical protein AURDEDRAFT_171260 [Auricularia subglabra TFB-10046 SS5]
MRDLARARSPGALLMLLLLGFLGFGSIARASSSGAEGGSGRQPPPPPSPIPDDMALETVSVPHPPGARLPVSWAVTDVPTLGIYPEGVQRFFTRRWTSATTSWISPNSPTRGMPLPPPARGARPCGCYDLRGRQTSVYGQLENGPMWPWMADWYDPHEPVRPYAANIWEGMGPCPRLQHDSVLHRFPAHRRHEGPDPWFWVADAAHRDMESQETLDESMLPLLFPAARISVLPHVSTYVYEGAQNLSLLCARWAAWVRTLLERRALIVFEIVARFSARALRQGTDATRQRFDRLRQQRYFGRCPQGAWFDDVIGSAGIIRQFILEGVLVYYRWEAGYETLPFLADLAPAEPPLPGSPRYFPPPTPRRLGPDGTLAPGLPRHFESYRIPPAAALGRDGFAEVMDDVTLHQLEGLDPDRSPPAEVLSEENDSRRRSSDSRSDGSSTLSWGSSMDYDNYESPPRPAAPLERVPALLRRMSNVARDAARQSEEPESPTAEMLRRAAPGPDPPTRPPLAAHITSPRPQENTATREPSIFDFLRIGDGNAERGPFIPAPSRQIHPRVPNWGLIIQESADSAAAREYFRRREAGELDAPTEQLEYVFQLAEAVPSGDIDIHDVPAEYCLARDTPLDQRYYQWAGGIIWRIARWAGLTLAHAMDGPTTDVREEGSRNVMVLQGDDGLFPAVDDWLSDDEVDTLLGVLTDQAQSIWPDALVLGRNWWQGEWTDAHERWFRDTLRAMYAHCQQAATRTRAQFRDYFGALDYASNGAARQGRNKAGKQGGGE